MIENVLKGQRYVGVEANREDCSNGVSLKVFLGLNSVWKNRRRVLRRFLNICSVPGIHFVLHLYGYILNVSKILSELVT